MEINVTADDGEVLRIEGSGPITQGDVSRFDDPMRDLLGEAGFARKVVFGLANVEYIDSSGMSWLMACHKRCRKEGGKLVIHSVPPVVMEVIKILKFHQVLRLAKNEKAALAEVQRQ